MGAPAGVLRWFHRDGLVEAATVKFICVETASNVVAQFWHSMQAKL